MKVVAQVALLSLIYVGFDHGARAVGSPIPGSVIGACVLAALLLFDVVPLRFVEAGAELLLRYLALFFVPAAVLAVRSWAIVRPSVLGIALVAIVSTILVLFVTGLVSARFLSAPSDGSQK